MDSRDLTMKLASGRILGWAEFGDPAGFPVLYFHGLPGSRLEAVLTHESAGRHQVRVIAVDRPGFGLSEHEPDRRILDWPDRVLELTVHLGLERFSIIGVSGGAPYAAVCAYRLPEHLQAVGLVCGMAPLDGLESLRGIKLLPQMVLRLQQRHPKLGEKLCLQAAGILARHAPKAYFVISQTSSPPDRAVLGQAHVFKAMTETIQESVRNGGNGIARDLALFWSDWGFPLEKIHIPVTLWHGERDLTLPADFSRRMARRIPDSRISILPHQGHFSLPVNFIDEIIETVAPPL